ncbi:MAG: carboxypeptidase regulatory-like domain-containing protein [Pyrinomonadaceae bacterium]
MNSQTALGKNGGAATVAGKVTIKGEPAAGIVVGLRKNEPMPFAPTFKATTDKDGKYRAEVPQGSYVIAPIAPALVIAHMNNSSGQSVIVNEGENIEGIDFDLMRGGVITGKVTDTDGRPIVEESVNLLTADRPSGSSYHVPGSVQTDDRGIYRFFGIRPGRYKVSVGQESVYRGVGRGRPSLPTTFHPDASEAAQAGVIEVGEGSEATSIDITVGHTREGFAVSGRVIEGDTGKPVSNVTISLSKITIIDKNNTSGFGGSTDVRSKADGAFRLEKLPPGRYAISIQPEPESNLKAASVTVDVIDQDVSGLLIKTATGASLSGTVVLEGSRGSNITGQTPTWLSVQVRSDNRGSYSNQGIRIKPDGSFRVGGLVAGNVTFSVGTFGPTGNAQPITVSRVERDGVVQPAGIQVQTGEHLSGLRIVAAYSSGSIRGVVKVENGTLPSDARLIVSILKMGDAVSTPSGGGTLADARGRFVIEGLAAGTYELTGTAFIPGRRGARTAKQIVTVTDGSATDVMLAIDLTTPMP